MTRGTTCRRTKMTDRRPLLNKMVTLRSVTLYLCLLMAVMCTAQHGNKTVIVKLPVIISTSSSRLSVVVEEKNDDSGINFEKCERGDIDRVQCVPGRGICALRMGTLGDLGKTALCLCFEDFSGFRCESSDLPPLMMLEPVSHAQQHKITLMFLVILTCAVCVSLVPIFTEFARRMKKKYRKDPMTA